MSHHCLHFEASASHFCSRCARSRGRTFCAKAELACERGKPPYLRNMHAIDRFKTFPGGRAIYSESELCLFKTVLEQVCRDLKVTDAARRSRLEASIFFLAKEGVRDFQTLRNHAEQPRINRFSMVDPA